MERKPPNELFRLAVRRVFFGLAAHEAMEEIDARLMILSELRQEGLLPLRSPTDRGKGGDGPGPIDHWRKGYVPGDPRVVEYLAEVGFRRAQLGEAWLKTFLEAAGYSTSRRREVEAQLLPGTAVLNNLPQYDPVRFVGREAELARLHKLVSPDDRAWIIQIDGVGGVGKSALALQLAYDLQENFARRARAERFEAIVWITAKEGSLDALGVRRQADPPLNLNDVYLSVADALDRPDIRTADAETRPKLVKQALSRQRTLLIMDNLDVGWGAELVSFIHDVPPPTKVVVTTRHRIDEAHRVHLEELGREEALRFIGQEAALKNVVLSEEDAARLYEAIGGIPLALKWCLGQMAFCLTVDAVLVYVSQGVADVNRYIFDTSIALLQDNPTAYQLLLALVVAAGDVSREAWGSMAGLTTDILRRDQAIGELEKLSLVNHDALKERFWLLPLARSYLRPKLADAPELERALFHGLVRHYQQQFPVVSSGADRFWDSIISHALSAQFKQEWVNLKALLAQLHQAGEDEALLTLGLPLVHTMNLFSLVREREALCRWMIDAARKLGDPVEAWLWIDGLGWMLRRARCYGEWLEAIDEGRRAVGRHDGPALALVLADVHEAYARLARDELPQAEALLRKALQSLRPDEVGDSTNPVERLVASRLSDHWFRLLRVKGAYAEARQWLLKSLTLRQSAGDEKGSTCYYLGDLSLTQGELPAARDWFAECLRTASHERYPLLAIYGLAQVAAAEGRWGEAQERGREALTLLEGRGFSRDAAKVRSWLEGVRRDR